MRRGWLVLALCLARPLCADVDHSLFTAALAAHVKDGRVDYSAFKTDAGFAKYLTVLAAARPDDAGDEKGRLALAINAYNAFVIQGVVDHWPLRRVNLVEGFFDTLTYKLGGQDVTLDQLENKTIRALGDARAHAALVCGAVSCPPLRPEAFAGAKLDQQLDDQCARWVNDATKNRLDKPAKKLLVSMIFYWYRPDFEKAGGAAGFMRQYLQAAADKEWLSAGDYQLEYLKYNWDINARQ